MTKRNLTALQRLGRTAPARRARRHGGTLVEFGVVIPIFLVFVLGLIEVGRAFMASHVLTNAARVGCRQGVLTGQSTSTITSTVSTFLQNQGVTGATITVKVNGAVADPATAASNDDITVTVSSPVTSLTWVPVNRYLTGSITGQYSLRKE